MMRIELNGKVLHSKKEWTPFVRQIVRRIKREQRYQWCALALLMLHPAFAGAASLKLATGIMLGAIGNLSNFTPVLRVYTSGSSATETQPSDCLHVEIEEWGSGGSGGFGDTGVWGGGGGAGGYSHSKITAQPGKTFTYTVGAAPGALNVSGSASTVANGTASNLTTMTANGGVHGANSGAGGAGGAGGTASGGTLANTTGAAGTNGIGSQGQGANGTNGNIASDGAPHGGGGAGASNAGGANGTVGLVGAVVFYYTGVV